MNMVQRRDANEYVNRLKYIGKLKREWYMQGVREERVRFRKLLEGKKTPLFPDLKGYSDMNKEISGRNSALDDILAELKL